MTNSSAGIGDPYWYEWTVGLRYIIQMLDETSGIRSVTLQDSSITGWDDVVVERADAQDDEWIQVKHSRVDDTLTFGDLVSTTSDGPSLLHSLQKSWRKHSSTDENWKAIFSTNRPVGKRAARTRPSAGATGIYRPALADYWEHISEQLKDGRSIDEIEVPDEWEDAWSEWNSQLDGDSQEKTAFLNSLEIRTGQVDLDGLEDDCRDGLARIFGIPVDETASLFSALDHKLRHWTTTRRDQEHITREEVYEVLVGAKLERETHYVVRTPCPFFPSREQFAARLEERITADDGEPLYFLSGVPGSGKSSLVSYLSRRSDPAIDLRYYAFRPISPEFPLIDPDADDEASPRRLWETLLGEFQELLGGRLAEARVPVIPHLMRVEEMRAEVLRLAQLVAEQRNRDVVICIDGLDHAARAKRKGLQSLLESLIPPEQVPQGVRFLLVGQPPEDYPEYPDWLVSDRVTHMELPQLQRADIETLVEAKAEEFAEATRAGLVDAIENIAQGNTLAAVFAVEEAVRVDSPDELIDLLDQRNLNSSVSDYYEHIWNAVCTQHNVGAVAEVVAASLALSPSRVRGEMLVEMFPQQDWSVMQWQKVLRDLGPLVIEDSRGFLVAQNDVRLFLEAQAKRAASWYRDVASAMADYYLENEVESHERHAALFRLLTLADRTEELAEVFSPTWVVEAAALGRPLRQVREEAEQALDAAIGAKSWTTVINVLCGAQTFERWDVCHDLLQGSLPSAPPPLPPGLLASEGRIETRENWSVESLVHVVQDAFTLVDSGRHERAAQLLNAWFGEATVQEVVQHCDDAFLDHHGLHQADEPELSPQTQTFLQNWGRVAARAGCFPGFSEKCPDGLYARKSEGRFVQGALASAADAACQWKHTVDSLPRLYLDPLFDACRRLHELQRWNLIEYVERRCSADRVADTPGAFPAYVAFALLMEGHTDRVQPWLDVVNEGKLSRIGTDYQENALQDALVIGWVLGASAPEHDSSTILDHAGDLTFILREQKNTGRRLLFGAITSGRIWGAINLKDDQQCSLVPASRLGQCVNLLFETPSGRAFPIGYHKRVDDVLQTLVPPVVELPSPHMSRLVELARDAAEEQPVLPWTTVIWQVLDECGDFDRLESWARSWLPDSGRLSSLRFAERIEVADQLSELCQERFHDLAEEFTNVARYSRIGYKIDDEYSLQTPLGWLRPLLELDAENWEPDGLALYALSRGISARHADNRMTRAVASAVGKGAAAAGPNSFVGFLKCIKPEKNDDWLEVLTPVISEALAKLAGERENVRFEEAWGWWCLSALVSRWFLEQDNHAMAELRIAIQETLDRSERVEFAQAARKSTPLESQIDRDPDRYVPPQFWGGSDDGEEGFPELDQLTLPEAVTILEDSREHDAHRYGIAAVLTRLKDERPHQVRALLERLVDLSKVYDLARKWSWSGTQHVVRSLVPLLTAEERWRLARRIREDADPSYSLTISAENLATLVRSVAVAEGGELLAHGYRAHLAMHQAWYSGAGHVCEAPALSKATSTVDSWQDAVVSLALVLFEADSSETVAAAMRGLNACVEIWPEMVVDIWELAGPCARKWLLLLLEYWAVRHEDVVEGLEETLRDKFDELTLENRLQCWLVLDALNDPEELPVVFRGEQGAPSDIVLPQGRLLELPPKTQGSVSYSQGYSMELQRLKRLEAIADIPLDEIEACMAQGANIQSESDSAVLGLRRRGDTVWPEFDSAKRFFECLDAWARKNAPGLPTMPVIHSVCYSDEPHFLARSPRQSESGHWPEAEPGRETSEDAQIRGKLLRVLAESEISDGEIVVAGKATWYTHGLDYTLRYYFAEENAGCQLPIVPLGRTAALRKRDSHEPTLPNGMRTIAQFCGGLHRFSHYSLELVPSKIWWEQFGWEPTVSDPLVWTRNDETVAWYDRAVGPPRFAFRAPHHRFPRMDRWIVKQSALDEIGIRWESRNSFNVDQFDRE